MPDTDPISELIDSFDDQVALLDEQGVIVAVNKAWRRVSRSRSGAADVADPTGVSYLDICRRATGAPPADGALETLDGLSAVLGGRTDRFAFEYACHDEKSRHWFRLVITPLVKPFRGAMVAHHDITEIKLTELALKASEQRYRTLIEQSLEAIVVISADRIIYANCSALCLHGARSPEELVGRRMIDLVHPDFRKVVLSRRKKVAETGTGGPIVELRYLRLDGTAFDVEVQSVRIHYDGATATQITYHDITARKKSEADLRRLVAIVESSTDAIIGKDLKSIITSWNKGAETMFGYTAQEILGSSISRLIPADRQDEEAVIMAKIERGENVEHFETQRLNKEGKLIEVSVGASPIRDEFGNVVGVSKIVRDVTKVKEAQRALSISEERYRRLFEVEQDAVMVVDADDGRLVDANPAALKLYGYDFDELLSLRAADLSAEPENTLKSIHGRESKVALRHHRKKDASVFPVEIRGSYCSLHGRNYYVATLRDLTEREQAQKTLKLVESQLRQAQKMEAVGQLAGGVAHDFNNIMAAVFMHLSLLQETAAIDSTTRESLKELEADVKRGTNLTRQLLAFSRQQAMEPKLFDLQEIAGALLHMLRRLLGEHIELSLDARGPRTSAEVDRGMIEQVVINLCVNARDAMPRGGRIVIRVEAVEIADSVVARNPDARKGQFVCLSVIDNGEGMDQDTLDRIFEPFFTTKALGKGTGLGLATVYGIVKQHHGWVEVESQVGVGSTFRVYLEGQTAPVSLTAASPRPNRATGGNETVLLVEDDPNVRKALAKALRSRGYTVHEASDGPAALQVWDQHGGTIALLLSDMVMPGGLTGLDLADRFRAIRPSLKFIASTGYGPEGQMQELRRRNITVLNKPYEIETLLKTVRSLLDSP